jgi:hypothetical protein
MVCNAAGWCDLPTILLAVLLFQPTNASIGTGSCPRNHLLAVPHQDSHVVRKTLDHFLVAVGLAIGCQQAMAPDLLACHFDLEFVLFGGRVS